MFLFLGIYTLFWYVQKTPIKTVCHPDSACALVITCRFFGSLMSRNNDFTIKIMIATYKSVTLYLTVSIRAINRWDYGAAAPLVIVIEFVVFCIQLCVISLTNHGYLLPSQVSQLALSSPICK